MHSNYFPTAQLQLFTDDKTATMRIRNVTCESVEINSKPESQLSETCAPYMAYMYVCLFIMIYLYILSI